MGCFPGSGEPPRGRDYWHHYIEARARVVDEANRADDAEERAEIAEGRAAELAEELAQWKANAEAAQRDAEKFSRLLDQALADRIPFAESYAKKQIEVLKAERSARYTNHAKFEDIKRRLSQFTCPRCHGTRLVRATNEYETDYTCWHCTSTGGRHPEIQAILKEWPAILKEWPE